MFKSCKSKMATSAHDVCDVQKASSLCIKTCWQSLLYMYMYNTYVQAPLTNQNLLIPTSCKNPPNQIFISSPLKVNSPFPPT